MALLFQPNFADLATIAEEGGVYDIVPGDIVPGYSGNAVSIAGSKYLKYPTSGKFNFGKGAIQLRFKPNWDTRVLPTGSPALISAVWYGPPGDTGSQYVEFLTALSGSISLRPYFHGITQSTTQGLPYSDEPYGIQNCRSDSWSLLEIYWDFVSATDRFLLFKINDRFHTWCVYPVNTIQAPDADTYIFVGTNTGAGGQFNGLISDLKIYDDPADLMPVAPADFPRAKFYDPWEPENPLKNEARIRALFPDGSGYCAPWETHATNPTNCPLLGAGIHAEDDVLFFKKYHLEQVYEGTVPTEDEIDDAFTWKVNPGEKQTLFFNVHTRIALTNVTVNYEQFSGSPGVISKANVDLRIVKNWWQGSDFGGYAHSVIPSLVGELLLHDDTIALDEDETLGILKAPTLPIQDYVTTAIAAATSRQFAMIVNIPSDTAPGNYTCTVTLSADGGVNVTRVITLAVLPFALRDYDQIRTTYYWPSEVDDGICTHMGLDKWDVFQKRLATLREMGYNGVLLAVYVWADAPGGVDGIGITGIDTAINYIAAAGFKSLAIYGVAGGQGDKTTIRYTQGLVDLLNASGIEEVYLQGEDEFDHQTLVPNTGLVNQTVAIDTTAKTLTLAAGNWGDFGFINQPGQLNHLRGCTSPDNDGVYITSYISGNKLYYSSTTAPSPVTEAGNGNQVLMDYHWVLQVQKAKHINSLGCKVFLTAENINRVTSYCSQDKQDQFNVANYPLPGDPPGDASIDLVCYNIANRPILVPDSARINGVKEGFYWQQRDHNARWHRHNVGYELYLANLTGAAARFNVPGYGWNEFNMTYCQMGISYPSVDGVNAPYSNDSGTRPDFQPIPAYNTQAQNEGVRDGKFLATWQWWYDRVRMANPAKAAASKDIIDVIKERYTDTGVGVRPHNKVSFSQWDTDREAIISEILSLKNLPLYCRGLVCGVIPEKVGGKNARKVAGARL